MSPWADLLRKPAALTDQSAAAWFARIADHLLNRTCFVVAGVPHRLAEIEFYYRGPGHEDPFTHGDPVQVHAGRWYFHKTAGAYRGGSFKGLDLTFGSNESRAGILFRGMTADDTRIDGPSLLVDRLLRLCGQTTVAQLDRLIGSTEAWNPASPLHFVETGNLGRAVLACARVGLSLRKSRPGSHMPAYLTRPYRFLTEPAAIAKGKAQMVMALHRAGQSVDDIRRVTGCTGKMIAACIAEYNIGLVQGTFEEYFGKDLTPKDICRLHGIADRP